MHNRNSIMEEIRATIPAELKIKMELSVAIANRVYEILERRALSQKEFARMLGKTETEVSRWLSGTHNLTLSTIAKISAALGEEIIEVASSPSMYSMTSSESFHYLSDSNDYEGGSQRNISPDNGISSITQ